MYETWNLGFMEKLMAEELVETKAAMGRNCAKIIRKVDSDHKKDARICNKTIQYLFTVAINSYAKALNINPKDIGRFHVEVEIPVEPFALQDKIKGLSNQESRVAKVCKLSNVDILDWRCVMHQYSTLVAMDKNFMA